MEEGALCTKSLLTAGQLMDGKVRVREMLDSLPASQVGPPLQQGCRRDSTQPFAPCRWACSVAVACGSEVHVGWGQRRWDMSVYMATD